MGVDKISPTDKDDCVFAVEVRDGSIKALSSSVLRIWTRRSRRSNDSLCRSYKRLENLKPSHRLLWGIVSYEESPIGRSKPETCDDQDHIIEDHWISGKVNKEPGIVTTTENLSHIDTYDTILKNLASTNNPYALYDMVNRTGSCNKDMDTFTESHNSPPLSPSENVFLFLKIWDGSMINLAWNLQSVIKDLRNIIYDQLGIPIHLWCLTSCAGRLLLDNRTLAYYHIRERGTVVMRLLLRGGARESGGHSRKCLAPWSTSNKPKQSEQPFTRTIFTSPRRSERLKFKRQKKENEEKTVRDTGSSITRVEYLNTTGFSKERLHTRNSVAVNPSISSIPSPTVVAEHTGLTQDLQDLAISDNYVLQGGCKGKSGNIESTALHKTHIENIKSPNGSQCPNIPLPQEVFHNGVVDSTTLAKELPKPKILKPSGNTSKGQGISLKVPKLSSKPPNFKDHLQRRGSTMSGSRLKFWVGALM